MANQDANGTVNYWIDGTSGALIRSNQVMPINTQIYWNNGNSDGYLAGSSKTENARAFCILIGF